MEFKRVHHQHIAQVLQNLDAALLDKLGCYFGGGTALALLHGEYRQSNDMDFLISGIDGYREMRALLTGVGGFKSLAKPGGVIAQVAEVRADQYGVRGRIEVEGISMKLEIVFEGRIKLGTPADTDRICGVAHLSQLDLAAEKLLANSDRWLDAATFSRDIIDLAMMDADRHLLQRALAKAELAYGVSIKRDLAKATERVLRTPAWLDRCVAAMDISEPKASLVQRLVKLGRQAGISVKLGKV